MALEPTKHVNGRMWPPRRLGQPERPTGLEAARHFRMAS